MAGERGVDPGDLLDDGADDVIPIPQDDFTVLEDAGAQEVVNATYGFDDGDVADSSRPETPDAYDALSRTGHVPTEARVLDDQAVEDALREPTVEPS